MARFSESFGNDLIAGIAIYSKAFLETLAKHHAEGLIEAVRTRFRKNGKATELLVGPGDGTAATLVITSDTPDEARLAVLDLDVTAEDVRGQFLRWDAEAETCVIVFVFVYRPVICLYVQTHVSVDVDNRCHAV